MGRLIKLDPDNTELTFNLWAFADKDTGFVYALAGRAYRLCGNDEEKLAALRALSFSDYHLARRHPVSKRFSILSAEEEKSGIASTAAVNDPDAQLFEEIFKLLEEELPPLLLPGPGDGTFTTRTQTIPESPLSVRTVLIEDQYGNVETAVSS
jgi:hypothetical protein